MMIGHSAMLFRLASATVLGGLIGLERERQGRPAGLRTHLLVAISSATYMLVSTQFVYFQTYQAGDQVTVDPSRIAASVVTGIGFLGAGAILRSGISIQGLTTAASLWLVAAIGLAAGGGMHVEAAVATGIALFCLVIMRGVEGRKGRMIVRHITLTVGEGGPNTTEILSQLSSEGVEVTALDYDRRLKTNKTSVMIEARLRNESELQRLVSAVESIRGATRIKIQNPV